MSGGVTCRKKDHRPHWVVLQRNYHQSAFSGYHRTYSDYSEVRCTVDGCRSVWRTKAAYVETLPDACRCRDEPAQTYCRICRQALCYTCFTDHHHEGFATPATDTR